MPTTSSTSSSTSPTSQLTTIVMIDNNDDDDKYKKRYLQSNTKRFYDKLCFCSTKVGDMLYTFLAFCFYASVIILCLRHIHNQIINDDSADNMQTYYDYTTTGFNDIFNSPIITGTLSSKPKPIPSSQILSRIFYFNNIDNEISNDYMNNWLKCQSRPYSRIQLQLGPENDESTLEEKDQIQWVASYDYLLNKPSSAYYYGVIDDNDSSNNNANGNNKENNGISLMIHDDTNEIIDFTKLDQAITDQVPTTNITHGGDWDVLHLHCSSKQTTTSLLGTSESESSTNLRKMRSDNNNDSQQQDWNFTEQWYKSSALIWRDSALKERFQPVLNRGYLFSNLWEGLNPEYTSIQFKTYSVEIGQDICRRRQHSISKAKKGTESTLIRTIDTQTKMTQESLKQLQQQQLPEKHTGSQSQVDIDRIYYHNLQKNHHRRKSMDFWLSRQPVPYKRIDTDIGLPTDECVKDKNTNRDQCRATSGLVKTLLNIIDNENTTGLSLVLNDDYVLTDPGMVRLKESLNLVPDNWDLIRFDCLDTDTVDLKWLNPVVAETSSFKCDKNPNRCYFCGGTHAMLWRGDKVHRLRNMWSRKPYDDADCVISGSTELGPLKHNIRSYCVNIGLGDFYRVVSEDTDYVDNTIARSDDTSLFNLNNLDFSTTKCGGKKCFMRQMYPSNVGYVFLYDHDQANKFQNQSFIDLFQNTWDVATSLKTKYNVSTLLLEPPYQVQDKNLIHQLSSQMEGISVGEKYPLVVQKIQVLPEPNMLLHEHYDLYDDTIKRKIKVSHSGPTEFFNETIFNISLSNTNRYIDFLNNNYLTKTPIAKKRFVQKFTQNLNVLRQILQDDEFKCLATDFQVVLDYEANIHHFDLDRCFELNPKVKTTAIIPYFNTLENCFKKALRVVVGEEGGNNEEDRYPSYGACQ